MKVIYVLDGAVHRFALAAMGAGHQARKVLDSHIDVVTPPPLDGAVALTPALLLAILEQRRRRPPAQSKKILN